MLTHRFWIIASLILAGEAIFCLPFHVARFFRASVLEVFALSNADLGDIFAVYGITAMIAYFPGGAIADRFSARKLMALSLVATALGGVYMASIPQRFGLSVLFAYWGVTSILLFWAALIRSTREWGGDTSQGRAFGILDGGRGLVAAGLASVAVAFFAHLFQAESASNTALERTDALVAVIYFYTGITFFAGAICWLLVPDSNAREPRQATPMWYGMREVMTKPIIWTQALIVICAYCGYKGLDNYALYAVEILEMSEVEGAQFTASCAYLRPLAAVAAGLFADRVGASRSILILFAVLTLSYGYLGFAQPIAGGGALVLSNILLTFAGVYALRGVYFALLQETQIPSHLTGSAVGIISLVGYTPDVFFAAIGGRLIDNAPGLVGHQHYFLFLSALMVLGIFATSLLIMLTKHRPATPE